MLLVQLISCGKNQQSVETYNTVSIGIRIRDETIWRYIDTVSIRRLTIRIVAQRDISRYDLDICNQGKSPRCLYFFLYLTSFSYSFKKYNLCWRCLCKMPA